MIYCIGKVLFQSSLKSNKMKNKPSIAYLFVFIMNTVLFLGLVIFSLPKFLNAHTDHELGNVASIAVAFSVASLILRGMWAQGQSTVWSETKNSAKFRGFFHVISMITIGLGGIIFFQVLRKTMVIYGVPTSMPNILVGFASILIIGACILWDTKPCRVETY